MKNANDLKTSIKNILTNNNLIELSLGAPDELNDPTYVIWYDNQAIPYEDPVIKVMNDGTDLSFEIDARDFGNTVTVQDYDIDRVEWWQGIHDNIMEVLQRDGKRICPACGKSLEASQQYCSNSCRDFLYPHLEHQYYINEALDYIEEDICSATGELKKRAQYIAEGLRKTLKTLGNAK